MEIADLVVISKYDSDFKKPCERLRRQIEGSLTLSMPKHMNDEFSWMPKVELVSSMLPYNIESVWNTATEFRK
jgi:putative protein kinase ArgK-like GTPase of G3E family